MPPRIRQPFYYSYVGSKYQEIPLFVNWLPTDQSTTIVEPFAGSAAVSYHLFQNGFHNINISDRDPFLLELWDRVRDDDKRNQLITELADTVSSISNKEQYVALMKQRNFISELIGTTWYSYHHKIYPMTGPRPNFNEIYNRPYTTFLQQINAVQSDFIPMCERYRNDPNAFIFLDPPYVNEDNSYYSNDGNVFDMESMYTYIHDLIANARCKVLMIVSDRLLMRLLFKDMITGSYPKQYQFSKKRVNHLIIANYTI